MLRIASTNTFIFTICLLLYAKVSDSLEFFFLFSLAKFYLILVILCVNVFVLPMDSCKNTQSLVHVTTKRRSLRTREKVENRMTNNSFFFICAFPCFLLQMQFAQYTQTHIIQQLNIASDWTICYMLRTCVALALFFFCQNELRIYFLKLLTPYELCFERHRLLFPIQ